NSKDCSSEYEIDFSFCDSRPEGCYEYPYDCQAYISCSESCAQLEYCPDEKLFNRDLHICDTPESVNCTQVPYPTPPATESPDTNPCEGAKNHTLLPSLDNCNEYIICVNEQSHVYRCPLDLLFNPDLSICDYEDEVWCYGDRTTQKPQETTTVDDTFNDCVGQKLGTCFPDTSNCQQYFYCWGNDSYIILPCPFDNWFNPTSGNCGPYVSPEACREIATPSTLGWTSAPTVATTSMHNDNPCAEQDVGASFPLQSDCQQYLICLGNGKSATAKCPTNSWFDPSSGDCGPNVSPTACLDAFTTTESSLDTTTTTSDDICAGQELGASFPLVTDCQKYIVCMGNGDSKVADCIYNAWFDPQTGMCGPEVSPTACKDTGVSTEFPATSAPTTPAVTPPITTLAPETTPSMPEVSDICNGLNETQYAGYPDDCRKYVICISPVPIAFYCPENLFFNQAVQKCVEWELSDCPQDETTTVDPGYTIPPPETSICFNKTGSNLPFLENCEWFIRCVGDDSYMMGVCSTGEFFDPWSGECGPDVAPDACLGDSQTTDSVTETTEAIQTTEVPTTSTPTATTPSNEVDPCEDQPEGKYVPYPDDCTKFIYCTWPTPVVYDCVEGQEFSAALERCMAPWYANCSIITTTTTTQVPSTTTITVPETSAPPNSFCDGQIEGSMVSYPRNCSKFIICESPIPVGYECPIGEEFSPIDLTCMDANLAGCDSNILKL
ncbi:hypothetical protein KR018_008811, partial [Drosophila ironensis]